MRNVPVRPSPASVPSATNVFTSSACVARSYAARIAATGTSGSPGVRFAEAGANATRTAARPKAALRAAAAVLLERGQDVLDVVLRLRVRWNVAVLLHRAGSCIVRGDRQPLVAAEAVEQAAQVARAAGDV